MKKERTKQSSIVWPWRDPVLHMEIPFRYMSVIILLIFYIPTFQLQLIEKQATKQAKKQTDRKQHALQLYTMYAFTHTSCSMFSLTSTLLSAALTLPGQKTPN